METDGGNWKPIQADQTCLTPNGNGDKGNDKGITSSLLAMLRPALFVAEAELTK